jgi:hypothetical protein
MKIVVDALWDDEAKVWVATARGDLGLVAEAPTVEALERRIAAVVPDLVEMAPGEEVEIELLARRSKIVIA